jgi:hypothetical protein
VPAPGTGAKDSSGASTQTPSAASARAQPSSGHPRTSRPPLEIWGPGRGDVARRNSCYLGRASLSDDGGADNYRPTNRGAAVEEGEDDAAGDEDGRPDVDALGVGRE